MTAAELPKGWTLDADGVTVSVPLAGSRSFALVLLPDARKIVGQPWRLDKDGYASYVIWGVGSKRCQTVYMHRVILGAERGQVTDHRNGDRIDNRRGNIRLATQSQNSANRYRLLPNTSSRFRGVTFHKASGKWQAQLKHLKRNYHLGLYERQEDAARAYDRAARQTWGEFCRPNFPEAHHAAAA
jgi:hypothetical protein